jgi:hypothetical protein
MAKRSDGMIALTERLLELEMALEKGQWIQYSGLDSRQEFSRDGINTIMQLARLAYIKNPLIKRGVDIQTFYVFGRGVTIQAKDATINEVVQAFLEDTNNQHELTSPQARKARDKELRIDGNLFFVLFVQPETGHIRIGTIPPEEISDIVRDKQNRKKALYYKRVYSSETIDVTNESTKRETITEWYADIYNYAPVDSIGDHSVNSDCFIYHVKTGGFSDWAFGVSEVYAALDWARAYKSFLEDFAKIIKSLARFAWRKKTSGGATGVQAARTKLNSTFGQVGSRIETNPSANAGAVMIETGDEQLDPIKTAGMTTSAESGKELRLMAGIAQNLPDHIASGDMAQGTLATAKSLDRPTEFAFTDRQELWVGIYKKILDYVVYHATAAPNGALRPLLDMDMNVYNEPVVIYPTGVNKTITVDFPSILQQDILTVIQALQLGATFNGNALTIIPDKKFLAKAVLNEFGLDDIDEIVEDWYPGANGGIQDTSDPILTQVKEALDELHTALLKG